MSLWSVGIAMLMQRPPRASGPEGGGGSGTDTRCIELFLASFCTLSIHKSTKQGAMALFCVFDFWFENNCVK